MVAQRALSPIWLARLDACDDLLVIPENIADLVPHWQIEPAKPIDMSTAMPNEVPKLDHLANFVQDLMEILVGSGEGFKLADCREGFLLAEIATKASDCLRVPGDGQAADELKFDRATQELSLAGAVNVDWADHGCVLGKYIHEAFLLKAQEGVSDGSGAHSKASLEVGAGEDRAWGKTERDNFLTQ